MDPKHEDEEEEAPDQATLESHREAGSSFQVTSNMLTSVQSIITEGFANITRKFEDALAFQQVSFSTQMQALHDKVYAHHHHTQEYLDSLREQLGSLEELGHGSNRDDSFDSPAI